MTNKLINETEKNKTIFIMFMTCGIAINCFILFFLINWKVFATINLILILVELSYIIYINQARKDNEK